MSFEGYDQLLCANGHLRVYDCYEQVELNNPEFICSCGAQYVFWHLVDQTNGIDPENIEGTQGYPFEIDKPSIQICCNLGHKHEVTEQTYKIPNRVKV